jgi:Flavin containing amine oxidoreductase
VICLSYTWNDDALKWLPLPVDERVRLMLHALKQIYPDVDIARHIVGDPITVSWEHDPNFMGAFKANLPGHYRYQRRLFCHFLQDDLAPEQRGIFLAGEDISWTAGWAEGAVQPRSMPSGVWCATSGDGRSATTLGRATSSRSSRRSRSMTPRPVQARSGRRLMRNRDGGDLR